MNTSRNIKNTTFEKRYYSPNTKTSTDNMNYHSLSSCAASNSSHFNKFINNTEVNEDKDYNTINNKNKLMSTNITPNHKYSNNTKPQAKKANNLCFSELYIAPNKMMINSTMFQNCDIKSTYANSAAHVKAKLKNSSAYNKCTDLSNTTSDSSVRVTKKRGSNKTINESELLKQRKSYSPKSRLIIEKECILRDEVKNMIEQLGNYTVKYNESIIEKCTAQTELKVLKNQRNKLIGDKSKLESQLENEKVDLDKTQRSTLNSLPTCQTPKKKYDSPIINNMNIFRKTSDSLSSSINTFQKSLQRSHTIKYNSEQLNQLDLINPSDLDSDLDMVINEFEMKISKLKEENISFFEYIDELNDDLCANEAENKKLHNELKKQDKELVELTKKLNHTRKEFNKEYPELKDKIIYENVNIDALNKTINKNLNDDIANFIGKK